MQELQTALTRMRIALAAERFWQAALSLRLALKRNPYWHLQPRVPAGRPDGGRWTAYLLGAAGSFLPILQRLGPQAVARVREAAHRIAPMLRRLPTRWSNEAQPSEESYDEETRRIGQNSWQRRGEPNIRFRSEDELRRYLGPAGDGREWHHIVEKRLAGRDGFPVERIHSTDNIINLPLDVHRRVSARMSSGSPDFGGDVRRFAMEKLDFGTQYDQGLDLVEKTLEEFGYDPEDF